uniref:Uncharacterized protein n=1 Tax=Anopheles coluzzii TaxID=1518534 RepID=A0A8W7PTW4_ANOCL
MQIAGCKIVVCVWVQVCAGCFGGREKIESRRCPAVGSSPSWQAVEVGCSFIGVGSSPPFTALQNNRRMRYEGKDGGTCVPEPDPRYGGRFPWPFTWTSGVRQPPLNPGDMANLHERINHLRPVWFEGFQLNVTKGCGVNRTLGASWNLSHVTPSGFRFGGHFQRRCSDSVLTTPLVAFDVNPTTLCTNLLLLYRPARSVGLELALQLRPGAKPYVDEVSLQYTGASRTSTVRCSTPDTTLDSYRVSLDHLVSVNDRLCFGVELLCECYRGAQHTNVAFAGRYNRETSTLAATVSPEAFDLSYWQKVSGTLQMGSSMIVNQRQNRALGTVCYRLEHEDTVIRGSFDSDWTVGFTYGSSDHYN